MLGEHKKHHERATPHKFHQKPIKPIQPVPVWVILGISIPIALLVTVPVIMAWIMGR